MTSVLLLAIKQTGKGGQEKGQVTAAKYGDIRRNRQQTCPSGKRERPFAAAWRRAAIAVKERTGRPAADGTRSPDGRGLRRRRLGMLP